MDTHSMRINHPSMHPLTLQLQENKAGMSVAVTEWSIRDGRVNLGLKECMHTFCMFITIIAYFSPPMPTKGRGERGSPREAEVSCFPSAGALLG